MGKATQLKQTPLFDIHRSQGARFSPFAGWNMPIQYGGILDEARSVRSHAGLFDVSHMGRVDVRGPGAVSLLDRVFSSDIPSLAVGRARYGMICTQEGGIIDDCIIYRRARDRILVVPNAANSTPVLEWIDRWKSEKDDVQITDVTSRLSMIALQGPQAADILSKSIELDPSSVRSFSFVDAYVGAHHALVARTGYTGEDGFELILPSNGVIELWSLLAEKGAAPCGLGARDILRLEAGLLLHGNDMDISTNPYEAGLDRFVDPDREGYVAGHALQLARDQGMSRVLVGFNMVGRGTARHGRPIMDGSNKIGTVTSGSYSPSLDMNIGLGYVPIGFSSSGSRFEVDIRGRPVEAEVTTLPFYSR